MPLIRSAIKKMRQDRVRTKVNQAKRLALKKVLKETRINPKPETLGKAFSALDRAVKTGLIHKNKAARGKASLAKLISTDSSTKKPRASSKKPKTAKREKS